MAQIPAGCFYMGDVFTEGFSNERPVHEVCLSAFEMDIHEITNAEYAACAADGVCTTPASAGSYSRATYYGDPAYDDFPVIYVSWFQVGEYCTWASKRLPTEAEWEYAARGGLVDKRYPWGDTISGADANYWNSGDPEDNDTNAVASYAANGYGLYDMSGNVMEWINDWFSSTYYQYCVDYDITDDPPGPVSGTYKVLRGGGFTQALLRLRVASRQNFILTPANELDEVGIRCAR